jgi:threonine synthase
MTPSKAAVHRQWPGLIEAYRDRLPVGDDWVPVTLMEGGTPLIPAPRLSERTGCTVHLKVEGLNPTGSFKDRGMTMAVTDAVARGKQAVLCASTGNTSASAAAYAARAGITCAVLIPQGKIAMGKLAQAVMHGARIIQVDGNFDDCLEVARKIVADFPTISLVNSVNPVRIEGQKTAAFEILEQLGGMPDVLVLPYGGGGNTKAYARGFQEAAGALPRFHPTEAERRADTVASAIRIVVPNHREEVASVLERSGGSVVTVSDDELLAAWRLLGSEEGIFCEPASAAGIAALEQGAAKPGERVVCVVTGHGLKDPDAVMRLAP